MQDLLELLKANPYPGRGIVVGKDCVYYWIMGRSANSRNRVFVECEDGIRTEAHDPSKLEDPSLIIYHPVRTMGDKLVVTNGDQTDTIVEKGDFFAGCMAREYEPDAPNFTPRISACINPDGSFEMSILKHQFEQGCDRCQRACPWNRFATPCATPEFHPREELLSMTRQKWDNLSVEDYRRLFKGSAVKRAKYDGLKRNIDALS